ncbi:single stranded nucleic acid binding protein [Actinomortierella ambigua]|nr:single stranded nucleic acid binding protein [Actinomortierella ambigua]
MSDKNDTTVVSTDEVPESLDVHFEPVVQLELVETKTHEEDEDAIFKMRAKLFRFVKDTNEWKERGTGEVRLMQHKESKKIRVLMRRDKTLKVCANHYISEDMKLTPNVGSDRSWVWNVAMDLSDDEAGPQTLAIRFANSDNAELFKAAFEKAQADNKALKSGAAPKEDKKEEEKKEEKEEEKKEEEKKSE